MSDLINYFIYTITINKFYCEFKNKMQELNFI